MGYRYKQWKTTWDCFNSTWKIKLRFVDEGLLHIDNNALKATQGAFLADGISADLFLIDFLAASSKCL